MGKQKHGHASHPQGDAQGRSRTYNTWQNMRQRTGNPNHNRYSDYGGRGITCCDRWAIFAHFLEDMGERPQGQTLDRIDVDAGYDPSNCRWATDEQQAANKRFAQALDRPRHLQETYVEQEPRDNRHLGDF